MFYCERCRKNNGWPESMRLSRGPCEVCGLVAECSDVSSDRLPPVKPRPMEVRDG